MTMNIGQGGLSAALLRLFPLQDADLDARNTHGDEDELHVH